jgi:hypothetical protein
MINLTKQQNKFFHVTLFCLMSISFFAGFLHPFFGTEQFHIQRIHVFLFNLATGGLLLLMYSADSGRKKAVWLFGLISLIFTLSASLHYFPLAIASALLLAIIVETIRIGRFSFFPINFFRADIPVSDKFHHAALLCLSMALIISAFSMIANIADIPLPDKMNVDIFFLGFSFPVSLIVMALIFHLMK